MSSSSANANQDGLPEYGDWGASGLLNETSSGGEFYHTLGLSTEYPSNALPPNASIVDFDPWKIYFPNGRNYTPSVGILGLGRGHAVLVTQSLLGQMKANGAIQSMFGGFHMGSAAHNQEGSMILGGYEQNRVLGEVGTFNLLLTRCPQGAQGTLKLGGPQAYMLDVVLSVETGVSPFNQSGNISLWHGIDDGETASESVAEGGRAGSRLVTTNPSVPYMYMPSGLCETAAQYLPVAWSAGLDLFIWDINDQYHRIVGSPAFMAIVFADKNAKNITIKVPFQLLNLTLTQPIVDQPTAYFPCKPNPYSNLELGRAFLQAAFLGFEYENNLSYIAQAPGPDMEQSIIKTFKPTDKAITPTTLGTLASS